MSIQCAYCNIIDESVAPAKEGGVPVCNDCYSAICPHCLERFGEDEGELCPECAQEKCETLYERAKEEGWVEE